MAYIDADSEDGLASVIGVDNAARVNAALLDHKIRIRDVSSMPGMGQHLRVTIGTQQDNDAFLDALRNTIQNTR